MLNRISAILCLLAVLLGLSSCALLNPQTEVSGSEYTCRLYGRTILRRIEVISDGQKVAVLGVGDARADMQNCKFELVDLNFDGHEDFRFIVSRKAEGIKYRCWLWNPASKTFIVDNTLNSLLSPAIDYEAKTISAPYRTYTIEPAVGTEPETYISEVGVLTYKWRQGRLVAVKKECRTYYSETEIYCVATWDINDDGELEPTVERWLTPEQYERAGYPPID
ncbi:MAG: hypothetical protein GX057_01220 [Clostridiales bacterium]|nr:hypothetical protein [Clostridiales bacterium]